MHDFSKYKKVLHNCIPCHRKYTGQHNQCDIRAAHDWKFGCNTLGRQRDRVVSVLDSQSDGLGFESRFDHYLDLFLGRPEFKSLAPLVNSQLVCFRPVAILKNIMFSLNYLSVHLFAHPR